MTSPISGIGIENFDELLKQMQASQAASTTATTQTTSTTSIASTVSTTTDLQTRIANDQQEIDDASELQTKNDKTIEELQKEVEELQAQIVKNMQQALNDGEAFSQEQETNINNAVTQTVTAYLNGEITKDKLMETMATKLSAADSEMGAKLNELIEGNDTIVNTIEGKISQICDLASQNDELETKIKNANKDIETAKAEAAKASETQSTSTDPIGFEQDDATYDFIVDRDNDGEFDGQNEFLGAQNGFDEMKALDKDGNGVVEGEELNGVKMIKTDKKTNTQSFVTAQEAGVTSIDLASYQAKNQKLANGNTLAGNYNVNVNGKSVEGYQTLDKTDWLAQNYGNLYGKSINSDTEYTGTTSKEVATNAVATTKKHIGLNDIKNLNADKENTLISDTTDSIDNLLNEGIADYTQSYDATINNLDDKDDEQNEDKSQNKFSTMSFMSMAYSMQAEDLKKKQAVA